MFLITVPCFSTVDEPFSFKSLISVTLSPSASSAPFESLMVRSAFLRVSNHKDRSHHPSRRAQGRSSESDRKGIQHFQAVSDHLKMIHFSSWPGFVPAIHVFLV